MLHVWNICQHLPQKWPSFVGKYSIHGASGIVRCTQKVIMTFSRSWGGRLQHTEKNICLVKNDGVRQLGWWNSQDFWENIKLMATIHHQPEIYCWIQKKTGWTGPSDVIKDGNTWHIFTSSWEFSVATFDCQMVDGEVLTCIDIAKNSRS